MRIIRWLDNLAGKLLIALIHGYQHTISRITPPSCRFNPTCSHYAVEALTRYGGFNGTLLAVWRIFRCNPWNPGGNDPVPSDFCLCHKCKNLATEDTTINERTDT